MGRKSKLEILVKFINDKNPSNIEDKELRVTKEEIFSDEKIDIAKSTLYKLVTENDFLLVDGEDLVLKRDALKLLKFQETFEKIYSEYDPKIGKKEMKQKDIFPPTEKQEELKELLKELVDYSLIRLKEGLIEFTCTGVRFHLEDKEDHGDICDSCLKPLSPNRTVITSTLDFGGHYYYELINEGVYHSECFAGMNEKEPSQCSFCGLPLSLAIYKKYLHLQTFTRSGPSFPEAIARMKETDRDKLISLVISSIQRTHLEQFNKHVAQNGIFETIREYLEHFFQIERRVPSGIKNTPFYKESPFKTESPLFKPDELPEMIELCMKYDFAEDQMRVEYFQKEKEQTALNRFIEFTGVYPEATGGQHVEIITTSYTDGNHLYHPLCFDRHKTIQQEEINKEGGNHS